MKKQKIDILKITRTLENQTFIWQKSIFYVVVIGSVIFLGGLYYIWNKPLDSNIEKIITTEIDSIMIRFDQKTLDEIKTRQKPVQPVDTTGTKNPFQNL